MRTAGRPLAALVAALTLAAAASPAHALFSDDEARKAILDVRGRVQLLQQDSQKQFDQLSRQLVELSTRLDRLEQTSRGQLELQSQLDAMRQEIARLQGQLEVQTNELATTQRQLRDQLATVDNRIRRFEPINVQIDGQTLTVEQNEKRGFDAALAAFRAGDFRGALTGFQLFRAQYPDSAYQPSVLFWIGSSQFALKDYSAAIASHQALIAKYPDNPRSPDALLNVGYAQAESGDRLAARATLESVIARYPNSQAAQLAKERLPALAVNR
ncbi:MAG: tol-pal system protein YbgF [Burkholderiales bacterium]|nr:tol-pal system protein YbgF [Burkholderiales bacterium]ODU62712.1 MAG: tol-pal system protein YbgF [Lautropia sp. SCN 66-9]